MADNNTKTPSILFVEDDKDISSIYKVRMEMEGFVVTICGDGESGVETAPSLKPDLILLDLMLPRMDGYTALKTFREMPETKQASIIVMSAIGEKQEIDRVTKLGADSYIVKSQTSIDDVMARLTSVLKKPTNP